jgi:hypothetical protein
MQTNRPTRLFLFFFPLPVATFADDLYLKKGLVYTNVLVVDTTGTILNIMRDALRTGRQLELIDKIEKREFIPSQIYTRSLCSIKG